MNKYRELIKDEYYKNWDMHKQIGCSTLMLRKDNELVLYDLIDQTAYCKLGNGKVKYRRLIKDERTKLSSYKTNII